MVEVRRLGSANSEKKFRHYFTELMCEFMSEVPFQINSEMISEFIAEIFAELISEMALPSFHMEEFTLHCEMDSTKLGDEQNISNIVSVYACKLSKIAHENDMLETTISRSGFFFYFFKSIFQQLES